MSLLSGNAAALGGQWYLGIGGASTWLQPNPDDNEVKIKNKVGVGGNLSFGLDIDDRSGAQLTLYSLGESELNNAESVTFQAFDGSIVYRIYDSKDRRITRGGMHVAFCAWLYES